MGKLDSRRKSLACAAFRVEPSHCGLSDFLAERGLQNGVIELRVYSVSSWVSSRPQEHFPGKPIRGTVALMYIQGRFYSSSYL